VSVEQCPGAQYDHGTVIRLTLEVEENIEQVDFEVLDSTSYPPAWMMGGYCNGHSPSCYGQSESQDIDSAILIIAFDVRFDVRESLVRA